MNTKYWLQMKRYVIHGRWQWVWEVRCRNGRKKAESNTVYTKKSLCFNDAYALASSVGLEVRQ